MQNKEASIKKRIAWTIMFLLPTLFCLCLWFYLTSYRDFDLRVCVPAAASRIGVEHNRSAVDKWIFDNLNPGMSREEVQKTLNKLGQTNLVGSRFLSDGTQEDTMLIEICSHPLNNINLYVFYSIDGKLIEVTLAFDN